MVASDSFAEFLREQLGPLGRVTMRRMFGKTGVFCDGVMLGMVRDNALFFRVDDHNRAAFKEAESFPPLNYEKKGAIIDHLPFHVSIAPRWRSCQQCGLDCRAAGAVVTSHGG
jgi:TfoX/Sxy family transcriptional regulator of competence genes